MSPNLRARLFAALAAFAILPFAGCLGAGEIEEPVTDHDLSEPQFVELERLEEFAGTVAAPNPLVWNPVTGERLHEGERGMTFADHVVTLDEQTLGVVFVLDWSATDAVLFDFPDLDAAVFGPDGEEIMDSRGASAVSPETFELGGNLAPGEYTVRVYNWIGVNVQYTLTATIKELVPLVGDDVTEG